MLIIIRHTCCWSLRVYLEVLCAYGSSLVIVEVGSPFWQNDTPSCVDNLTCRKQ